MVASLLMNGGVWGSGGTLRSWSPEAWLFSYLNTLCLQSWETHCLIMQTLPSVNSSTYQKALPFTEWLPTSLY